MRARKNVEQAGNTRVGWLDRCRMEIDNNTVATLMSETKHRFCSSGFQETTRESACFTSSDSPGRRCSF